MNVALPLQEVDLCSCGVWGDWWLNVGSEVQSLSLHSTGMGQAEFTRLLTPCKKLRVLNLNGARSLFREGQCQSCYFALDSLERQLYSLDHEFSNC